jgi:hypothetical protein
MLGRSTLRVVLFVSFAVCFAAPFHADSISLAWDDLNDPAVTGYRLYYGTSSGNYTQSHDAGLSTQAVLNGLSSCTDYYISVKAYVADGTESSQFATEVSGWARPIVTGSTPQNVQRGATADLVISGAGFRNGVSVAVSNPGVSVNGVTVQGCNQLTLNVSVSAGAALGAFDVTVTDPFGIVGSGTGVAGVTADTTAPAISGVQAMSIGSTVATIHWTTDEAADGRVFYREPGESAYQASPLDSAPATAHSIALTGLIPDATYEYYVQSADVDGNASTANGPTTFVTLANAFTYLRFEPENRPLTTPAEAVAGNGAFAGAWLQVQQGTPAGTPGNPSVSLDYGFTLPSGGSWSVWFRMYGINANANEWFRSVDGGTFASVQPVQSNVWEWVAATNVNLSAGQHTLTLGGAEARARIDRVLITDDPAFLPTEQPGSDVTPPSAVSSLSATPDDGTATLGWVNPADSDLARIVVVFRSDGTTPTSPVDGQTVIDRPASPGGPEGLTHSGRTNGVTLSYAVFAIDGAGNVSPPAAIDVTPNVQQLPPPAQVQNLHRTDSGG